MWKILIADDEKKIRETMRDYLSARGFDVVLAKDGKEALYIADCSENFDLIILDVMMPEMNGIEVCRELRKDKSIPILFLSALGEEQNLLAGYQVGADDYIVKPFPLSVLSEKCSSMIRRYKGIDRENKLVIAGITLDYAKRKVYAGEEETAISGKDFSLLAYLMENKNIVVEREIILSRIWGYDFEGDTRVVDTHIKRIRKMLGEKATCIKTVIGSGYVFRED